MTVVVVVVGGAIAVLLVEGAATAAEATIAPRMGIRRSAASTSRRATEGFIGLLGAVVSR